MNLPRLRELRDHMLTVKDEEFCYRTFFYDRITQKDLTYSDLNGQELAPQTCGTVACLCGHAAWHWREEVEKHVREHPGLFWPAAVDAILELDATQSNALFMTNVQASRKDAIRRLNWLINKGNLSGYRFDMEKESPDIRKIPFQS